MRKRNCRVQVRLDNKEYQGFMKAVRKSGLSQEVYLRHLINGVVPRTRRRPIITTSCGSCTAWATT